MGGEGLEIELKAIKSEADVGREKGFALGMKGEVGEVGQPSFPGLNV
jgi:hypothetical protein